MPPSSVGNRFTVLSIIEDLTTAGGQDDEAVIAAARARAIKHLPSLGRTLGAGWTDNEVVPFLDLCVRQDDAPVVTAIADALPQFVHAFGAERIASVVAGIAASSHQTALERLQAVAPVAFLSDPASDRPRDEAKTVHRIDVYVQLCCDLLRSPWSAAKYSALGLATDPLLHAGLLALLPAAAARTASHQLDDAVHACVKRTTTAIAGSPTAPQLEWLVVCGMVTAAKNTTTRTLLGLTHAYGAKRLGGLVEDTLIARLADLGYFHAAPEGVQKDVASAASLLEMLLHSGVAHTALSSPVATTIERTLVQLPSLLDRCTAVLYASVDQRLQEVVCAASHAILQATSVLRVSVDFRIRLLLGRYLAPIAESAAKLSEASQETVSAGPGNPFGLDIVGLVSTFVADALRSIAQDPDGDVRFEGAKSIALLTQPLDERPLSSSSQQHQHPDRRPVYLSSANISDMISLCEQVRMDAVAFTREAIAPAIANLCRGAHLVSDPRDRAALYTMLVDLVRDEAANVRLTATMSLSDCLNLVGRDRVEMDLCDAATALSSSSTQWRAREQLARGLPHVLELFVMPHTSVEKSSHAPATAANPSRNLFGGDEEDEEAAPLKSHIAVRSPRQSRLLGVIVGLLFDSAKAVRDASIESLCAAACRMCQRLQHDGYPTDSIRFDAIGLKPPSARRRVEADPVGYLLHEALWPLVRDAEPPKKHYLMRAAQLSIAVGLGVAFTTELLPLMQRYAVDTVANVRRAVMQTAASILQPKPAPDASDIEVAVKRMLSGHAYALPADASTETLLPLVRACLEDPSADVREAASAALVRCV
jgi:hypothetical protein